jgi:hypothetical protein
MTPRRGWPWFAAWAGAGALAVFAFLTGFSIGLFVLPFAVVALVVVWGRTRGGWEALGLLAGAGAIALLIAALHADPENRGLDPVPWLVAGLLLVGAGAGGYAVAKGRRPSRS